MRDFHSYLTTYARAILSFHQRAETLGLEIQMHSPSNFNLLITGDNSVTVIEVYRRCSSYRIRSLFYTVLDYIRRDPSEVDYHHTLLEALQYAGDTTY